MSSQFLLTHFDRLAEASGGLAKLRALVIDLAIRGNLAEQDATDESATNLLRNIRLARTQLVKSGEMREGTTLSPVDSEPYPLPARWEWVRLGETGRIFNGDSVSESKKIELSKVIDGYAFIATKDVGYGREALHYENGLRVPRDAKDFKVAHKNAVLICAEGGSAGKKLGQTDRDICFGNKLYANETWPGINPRYILFLYQSSFFFGQFKAKMKGIIGGIARSDFLLLPVPLPPSAEQHRIVAKVEELMGLCDALDLAQGAREAVRVRLRSSALHQLASSDSGSKSAEFVLNHLPRIASEPADIPLFRDLTSWMAVEGVLSERKTESWSTEKFENVVELQGGVTKGRNLVGEKTVELPYLRVANVQRGYLELDVMKSIEVRERESDKYALRTGDLVITEGGDWDKVGRTAVWREEIKPCIHQNHVFRARPDPKRLWPEWGMLALNSRKGRDYFADASKQTTNLASINMSQLRRFPIPLPPLAEQRRIVAKVGELMVVLNALEAALTISRTTAETLLETVIRGVTGSETKPEQAPLFRSPTAMKTRDKEFPKQSGFARPLDVSTNRFVLRRFAMQTGYRSLADFNCTYHSEEASPVEASPICLVGLNGSGKSNLIEAIAEVFCFLELINLKWNKVASPTSRYRENRHQFLLEYTIGDARGERLVRIRKTKKNGADFFIVKDDGTEEPVEPGRQRLLLLPRRIIGYSSGLNETVSHPFLRTKTIYSEEVRDAAPPDSSAAEGTNPVVDTRTLYMDYESNAAITISNYIFRNQEELLVFDQFTRVRAVTSFGIRFNRKRAGKSGPNSIVRLTAELRSYLESFAFCAGEKYDADQISYDLTFPLTPEAIVRFRKEFKTAENLFMAMHKWSLLNALILSDEQRNVYLSNDITNGALERPPSVPPSDRVFNIVDLKLRLSTPEIEIDYSGLSDGEHQFIQVFGTALLFSEPGTLFLFDEPESHFNPEWRTKFNLILNGLPNSSRQEYVISTHSPFVVSGSRKSNVYKFIRTGADINCAPVDFETYGASFDVLMKKLFSVDSMIDESAREDLEKIIQRGDVEEMQKAVEDFAESKEKRRLYEAIIQKEEGK